MSGRNLPMKRKISDVVSDFPEVGGVYLGKVILVQRLGCIVRLFGFNEKAGGFLFHTDIGDRTLDDLRPTTRIFVKVLSISEKNFLMLTMEAIDQTTGQDFQLSERVTLDPEGIKMATLPNFFVKLVQIYGGKAPPRIQELVDFNVVQYCMGVINEEMYLTDYGRKSATSPVVQPLWRILMAGVEFGCTYEVLIIVSMIAVECDLFQISRRGETQAEIERINGRFSHPHGDYLTFLEAFLAFEENGSSPSWCSDNLVDFDSLQRASRWRASVAQIMISMGFTLILRAEQDSPMIRKALVAGLFYQSARWDQLKYCYRTLANEDRMVHVHPHSVLCHKQRPKFIVYGSIKKEDDTNKEWITDITPIEPEWLLQVTSRWFTPPGVLRSAAGDPEDALSSTC